MRHLRHVRAPLSEDDFHNMIYQPRGIGAFEFVIVASLRALQLTRGCRPRIDGAHKNTVIAQLEVSQGKVAQAGVPPGPVRDTFVEL